MRVAGGGDGGGDDDNGRAPARRRFGLSGVRAECGGGACGAVSADGLLIYARSRQRQEPVAAAAAVVVAGSYAGSSGVGSSSAGSSGAFRGGGFSGRTWWLCNKDTVTAALEAAVERLAAADKEANDTHTRSFNAV